MVQKYSLTAKLWFCHEREKRLAGSIEISSRMSILPVFGRISSLVDSVLATSNSYFLESRCLARVCVCVGGGLVWRGYTREDAKWDWAPVDSFHQLFLTVFFSVLSQLDRVFLTQNKELLTLKRLLMWQYKNTQVYTPVVSCSPSL